MTDEQSIVLSQTTEVVAAFLSKNAVDATALPDLIRTVYQTLSTLDVPAPTQEELVPAVPIKKSVFQDHIICLDDGKKLKSLKRHLAQLGMTPDQYRAKWGLPANYPMVAPASSEKRKQIAINTGLGRNRAERQAA